MYFDNNAESSEEEQAEYLKTYIAGEPEIIMKEGWLKKEGPGKRSWYVSSIYITNFAEYLIA
jgi:hypothetical protein